MKKLINLRLWTIRLLGPVAALAILGSLMAPLSAAELRLLPRIVVDGDVVTLADLFGDIGGHGEAIVSLAPEPGKRLAITVSRIHRVVRDQGLDWSPLRGLMSVKVARTGRRIPTFEIESVILDALADEFAGRSLSISLANRNKVIFVAIDAAASLDVENLTFDDRSGRFVASLVAASGTPHEVRADFSGRAIESVELPMLNKPMKKGEIIGEGDIEWLVWKARRVPRDAITDSADLVGLAAGRSLRPGQPVRARDVNEPIVVAKGSAVSLVYRTTFMVLTAGGRALEDGAMGSIIRVLNSQSKVVVEARVEGGKILSVTNTTFLAMN